MSPAFTIADDGYITVEVAGMQQQIDLYKTQNQINDVIGQTEGKPVQDYHQGLADLIESLGFPKVSHRAAYLFAKAVRQRVDELGKVEPGETTPGSPTTTEPPPSDSPAESS